MGEILSGKNNDSATEEGNSVINAATNRQTMIPIQYHFAVPMEYSKKYDQEEYLLEIYKKLGIEVLQEADSYYYNAVLPDGIKVVQDDYGYSVKGSNEETLIHYYDRGPFYDRTVTVDKINVAL